MAYRTLNPFTEQKVQEFPEHTDAEVEAALAKAHALSSLTGPPVIARPALRFSTNSRG